MFPKLSLQSVCEGMTRQGVLGEPLNVISALSFIIGALIAWRSWSRQGVRDWQSLSLIVLIGMMGFVSALMHYAPSETTILIKLCGWILVTAWSFVLVLSRVLDCKAWLVGAHLVALTAASLFIAIILPERLFGHDAIFLAPLISLYVLACIIILNARLSLHDEHLLGTAAALTPGASQHYAKLRAGYGLLIAGILLALAFVARSYEAAICQVFSHGLHFVWHILVAATVTLIALAVVPFSRRNDDDASLMPDSETPATAAR